MATVYKRGRSWWVRYYSRGHEIRRSAKTTIKATAQAYLNQLLEEEGRLSRGGIPRHTVDELLTRFEAEHVPTLRSAESYHRVIKTIRPHLQTVILDQLSKQHLLDFIGSRQRDGLKPGSIKREMMVLGSALSFAMNIGWLTQSPMRLLDRRMLKPSPSRRRYLNHDEERRLIEAALPHVRTLIIFAIETGLRRGEQLSLKWNEVDLLRRELKLFVTKSTVPRIVPLSDRALQILDQLPRVPGSPFVFTNLKTGTRYVSIKNGLAGAAKKASIIDLRWHDLRRTCGCRLIQDHKADLYHVSRWLGHASTQMTEKAYAFLRVKDLHAIIRTGTKTGTDGTAK